MQGAPGGGPAIKILDFGIVNVISEQDRRALGMVAAMTEGTIMGTPSSLSPEQAAAQPVDARTDLCACGIVLFRMVTGKPPFTGSTRDLLLAHLRETPPVPSAVAPQTVAPEVDDLILRALAKAPAARCQDARAMRSAIEAILANPRATPAPAPAAPSPALSTTPALAGAASAPQPAEPTGTSFQAQQADDEHTTQEMVLGRGQVGSKKTERYLQPPPALRDALGNGSQQPGSGDRRRSVGEDTRRRAA